MLKKNKKGKGFMVYGIRDTRNWGLGIWKIQSALVYTYCNNKYNLKNTNYPNGSL